jgi:hypothetical protein
MLPMAMIGLIGRPMIPILVGLVGLFVWGGSTAIYLTLGTGTIIFFIYQQDNFESRQF